LSKRLAWAVVIGSILCFAQAGGASFTAKSDLQSTYKSVLNAIKSEGLAVEAASADAGIKTKQVVTGHYRQTGTHLEIQFIQQAGGSTEVMVTVYDEKRYKALQTEPWSTPKLNMDKSAAESLRLKAALGL